MKTILLSGVALIGLALCASPAKAMDREQVEAIIKDYIENNPSMIIDSVESYGRQQQALDALERQKALEEHMTWLDDNDMLPVVGNPDGDVTIVEFFDYNCGYCKKALDDVLKLMGNDDQVKFVLIETPILGPTSDMAARYAMAAKEQDAYLEYHIAVMRNRGPINETSLKEIGEKVGLDIEKLETDAKSGEIAQKVATKSRKASQMGITGTPAFIIDGQLYGGYIGYDAMVNAVEEARENG